MGFLMDQVAMTSSRVTIIDWRRRGRSSVDSGTDTGNDVRIHGQRWWRW